MEGVGAKKTLEGGMACMLKTMERIGFMGRGESRTGRGTQVNDVWLF